MEDPEVVRKQKCARQRGGRRKRWEHLEILRESREIQAEELRKEVQERRRLRQILSHRGNKWWRWGCLPCPGRHPKPHRAGMVGSVFTSQAGSIRLS